MTESVYIESCDTATNSTKPSKSISVEKVQRSPYLKCNIWLAFTPSIGPLESMIMVHLLTDVYFRNARSYSFADWQEIFAALGRSTLHRALTNVRAFPFITYVEHYVVENGKRTKRIAYQLDMQKIQELSEMVAGNGVLKEGQTNQLVDIPKNIIARCRDMRYLQVAILILMFKNRFKLSPYHVAKLTGVNNAIVKSVYKVAYKTIWDKVPNKNVCFVRKEGDAVTKFLELVLAAASVHTKGRIKNLRVGKNKNHKIESPVPGVGKESAENDVILPGTNDTQTIDNKSEIHDFSSTPEHINHQSTEKIDSPVPYYVHSNNDYIYKELTTRAKREVSLDEKCFSAEEVIELCKSGSLQDKLTLLVDDENRSRPRIEGKAVNFRNVMSCLAFYKALRGKPKSLETWFGAVRTWLAKQNSLYLATPMQSELITACRSPEQTDRAERLEDIRDAHAIPLPDRNQGETVDNYLLRAESYVIQASQYLRKINDLNNDFDIAIAEASKQGHNSQDLFDLTLLALHKGCVWVERLQGESAIEFINRCCDAGENLEGTDMPKGKTAKKLDWSALKLTDTEIQEVIDLRKHKKAKVTQRVLDSLAKEFELSRKRGMNNDDILNEWITRNWMTYKDEWVDFDSFAHYEVVQTMYNEILHKGPLGAPKFSTYTKHRKDLVKRFFEQTGVDLQTYQMYLETIAESTKIKHLFTGEGDWLANGVDLVLTPRFYFKVMESVYE